MNKGLFLFFQKQSRYSTSFQNAVAMICRGTHFHVEMGFGHINTETGERELYDDSVYCAYMFEPFTKRKIKLWRYTRPQEWDICFIPLTSEQMDEMKRWADSEVGVEYDYVGAFLAPVSNLRYSERDLVRVRQRRTLFCSEAAVIMLQIGCVWQETFQTVNPRCCTPESLYQLVCGNM
jgi:hypothetical protein